MSRHRTLPYLAVAGVFLIGGAIWYSMNTPAPSPLRRVPNNIAQFRGQMRPATDKEKQAALGTIRAQLDAFRRDDYTTAAKFQSAKLKKNFSSTAAFRRAIREGYPQFANYKTVAFGPVSADKTGNTVAVPVTLTGRDQVTVHGIYLLAMEGKTYRVTGVVGGTNPRQKPQKQSPGNALSPEMMA